MANVAGFRVVTGDELYDVDGGGRAERRRRRSSRRSRRSARRSNRRDTVRNTVRSATDVYDHMSNVGRNIPVGSNTSLDVKLDLNGAPGSGRNVTSVTLSRAF